MTMAVMPTPDPSWPLERLLAWVDEFDRPAPEPVDDGRLSPLFVEFMMGLPEGWVTDAPVSRSAQLRALGNGVVPQQAKAALELLDPGGAPSPTV